jgi:rod shape-determining protein MreC
VKLERRSLSRLAVPLKALVDRFAFAALIALSIGLFLIGKADQRLLGALGERISDTLAPVLGLLVEPIEGSRRLGEGIGQLLALHEENVRLREQNRRLLEWQAVARQLATENAALRQVLNLDREPELPTVVAGRVVADTGGPFVHTLIVNVGAVHGVAEGMAALNERGLVGRVIDVGARSARILLITDFNSRIPVMVEPSRDQAILAGDNSGEPGLVFLPLSPRLSVGDRVVTSGRGGKLPPGLPIGVVRAITDKKVAVAPFVDWDRLEYLRLLHYAPVLPPDALAELQREMYGPPPPPEHVPPGPTAPVVPGGAHPAPAWPPRAEARR